MSPLRVPNFRPIGVRICVLWRILQSVQKEVEEKIQKKIPNFGRSCLGIKWLERFSSNLECGLPT